MEAALVIIFTFGVALLICTLSIDAKLGVDRDNDKQSLVCIALASFMIIGPCMYFSWVYKMAGFGVSWFI